MDGKSKGRLRGRFAPSPTGLLHRGHARTMLLAWLHARRAGGDFVLRIEDIDRERCRPGAEEAILRDLRWLGFDWDEGPDVGGPHGPYRQSERDGVYAAALGRIAPRCYPCSCSRRDVQEAAGAPHGGELRYPGTCRGGPGRAGLPPEAMSLRARVDPGTLRWDDLARGPCEQDPSRVCGDFIVRSKGGGQVYQLACVADDVAMGVTHVVRGEDLLESTGRQLLLHRWLGNEPPPRFGHLPLLRDGSGERLAKRRGSPPLQDLRESGADPRAVVAELAASVGLIPRPEPLAPRELLAMRLDPFPARP